MTVIELQTAHITSVFQPKENIPAKRYLKTYSSSAVGRGGGNGCAATMYSDGVSSADAVSLKKIHEALEREDLEALNEVFAERLRKHLRDAPMDNRALAKLRRQAFHIARRELKQAVSEDNLSKVQKAMGIAEIADGHWLRTGGGVASTLEFKAARRYVEQHLMDGFEEERALVQESERQEPTAPQEQAAQQDAE